MEYWSTGVLEYWSIGVLEYWSTGVLVKTIVTGCALRVQFFNPQLETRNSQQSPITYSVGP
jgi:hypothetical protein